MRGLQERIVREEVALDCVDVRNEVGGREEVYKAACMVSVVRELHIIFQSLGPTSVR